MKEYITPIYDEEQDWDEMFVGAIRQQEELIRCKDCKIKPRCVMYRYNKDPYGFCKWAERKEE